MGKATSTIQRDSARKLGKLKSEKIKAGGSPIIFSFFSGAGFLDLGFEKAGFEIGYVNEIHKPFLDAYKHSRQRMGAPQPIHGYYDGDIESCFSGEEAKHLTRLIHTAKKEAHQTFPWVA